jgi:hypothetical protein
MNNLKLYIREALKQIAYEALPDRWAETSHFFRSSRVQEIAGRWEGYATHPIREGTILSLPGEQEHGIVVEHVISARTALRITFESQVCVC